MTASLLYRVAAVVQVLLAAGHTALLAAVIVVCLLWAAWQLRNAAA